MFKSKYIKIPRKYELLKKDTKIVDGHTLYRVRRLEDGSLGGYIQGEYNLSHEGDCFVCPDSMVYGCVTVMEGVRVINSTIKGPYSRLFGWSKVGGGYRIENSTITGQCRIFGSIIKSKVHNSDIEKSSIYRSNIKDSYIGSSSDINDSTILDSKLPNNSFLDNVEIKDSFHCKVITGLKFNLTLTPNKVFGGCRKFTREEFLSLTLDKCRSTWTQEELDNYIAWGIIYYEELDRRALL